MVWAGVADPREFTREGSMPEFKTVKRKGQIVRKKKCSVCNEFKDETDFHFRTPKRENRSSRCKFCAALAQRELRLRKKGLLPRKPGGRFGVDTESELPSGEVEGTAEGKRRR